MQSPSHTSITEALGVLSALENYPPRPLAYNQARALFAAHFAEALREPDQHSLLKRYGTIGDDCEPFAVMVHLSLLLKDTKVFPLTGSEVSRIRRLAERYLADDASLDYFILPLVRGEVLEAYVANVYQGADKAELLAEVHRFLAAVDTEKERFWRETRRVSAAERNTAASLRPALGFTERLAARLEPLLAKALSSPARTS